jgi:hypothetical protein
MNRLFDFICRVLRGKNDPEALSSLTKCQSLRSRDGFNSKEVKIEC